MFFVSILTPDQVTLAAAVLLLAIVTLALLVSRRPRKSHWEKSGPEVHSKYGIRK